MDSGCHLREVLLFLAQQCHTPRQTVLPQHDHSADGAAGIYRKTQRQRMIAAYETYAKDSTEVGGDFYDFYMIGDDKLAIIVADISGKGTPSALERGSAAPLACQSRPQPYGPAYGGRAEAHPHDKRLGIAKNFRSS